MLTISYELTSLNGHILYMKQLKMTKLKQHAKGHSVSMWRGQGSNPGLLSPRPKLSVPATYCPSHQNPSHSRKMPFPPGQQAGLHM